MLRTVGCARPCARVRLRKVRFAPSEGGSACATTGSGGRNSTSVATRHTIDHAARDSQLCSLALPEATLGDIAFPTCCADGLAGADRLSFALAGRAPVQVDRRPPP